MKKVILGSVLAIAAAGACAQVADQTFCSGASGSQTGATVTVGTATDNNFVKAAFAPKCSSNIALAGRDGGVYYNVGAGSTKGKTSFMGSSGGGGIVSSAACATTGCNLGNATTAMAAAPSS